MGDDGVGPALIARLGTEGVPDNVRLVDAGTALIDVLAEVATCARILIVDACAAGRAPGAIYRVRLDPDTGPVEPLGDSLHHLDLLKTLALHRLAGAELGDVVLIGIEPARVAPGTGVSEAVEARLPDLLQAVREEIVRPPDRRRGGTL
jgi:hydrogenase maturation protease